MSVKSIKLKRFNILAAYTRQPSAYLLSEELEHFATDGDRVLGVLIRDRVDDDYAGLVLGKDESGQYRCVDILTFTNLYDSAGDELVAALGKWHMRPDEDFFQGEPKKPFLEVFLPSVPSQDLNLAFLQLASTEAFTAARRVVESMMPFFQDVDGNFIQQFQTTAFDSRVWELYLFAALTELKIVFDRSFNAPDYLCDFFGYQFFVEATTVNPTMKNGIIVEPDPASLDKEKLKSYFTDYMPIKWGSALWSKLNKRYWELPHVAGKPIVLAVQDFHIPHSMSFSSGTLTPYLYGRKFGALYDATGKLVVSNVARTDHTWEGKTIPSGFFKQPNAEHISAVISNPLGTISKFNRMGVGAGFGIDGMQMILTGTMHDHDPNAVVPKKFATRVIPDRWDEPWCGGLNVFHNPRALHPLDPNIFSEHAQHFEEDGNVHSYLPEFHPYGVQCISVVPTRLKR
jgi:hypothetical protein